MKKLFLLMIILCSTPLATPAQSWDDLLKALFTPAASTEPTTPSEELISAKRLASTWTYQRAIVEYAGEDPLAAMAVGLLSEQIEPYSLKVGIVPERDKLILQKNGRAKVIIGEKQGSGTYRYNPKTGEFSISATIEGKSATLSGYTRYREGRLTLLFPAEKVLQTIKQAIPSLAKNEYMQIAETVIANYPGISIGAEF